MEKITVTVVWYILQALGCIKHIYPSVIYVVREHVNNYVIIHVIVCTFKKICYGWADEMDGENRRDRWGWVDAWAGGWVDGWVSGWMDGRMDWQTDLLTDRMTNRLTQNCTFLHEWNLLGMDSQIISTYKTVIKEYWYWHFQYLLDLVRQKNKENFHRKTKKNCDLQTTLYLLNFRCIIWTWSSWHVKCLCQGNAKILTALL
jgi:hypothetical protein